MKYFYPFIAALMFICFCIYGLWNSERLQQEEIIQSSQTALNNLQDSIRALQNNVTTLQDSVKNVLAKNPDLDVHMQINNLEKKVDTYQKLVSDTTNNMHEEMDDWLVILSIIITVVVALLGVVVPLIINYRNEKHLEKMLEDSKDKANAATKNANDALTALEVIQGKVQKATTQATTATKEASTATAQAENARIALVNSLTKVKEATTQATSASAQAKNAENALKEIQPKVEEAAKKAKAIQFFIQALQESDEKRAIELYDKCIGEDDQFAEAYNNRGFLRHKIGGPYSMKDIMDDYNRAIELFKNQGRGIYAEAYNNRGISHFENQELDEAENNFDAAITLNYAEAYLNRGLLNYQRGNEFEAREDFDNAIANKSNFAEAYYIRGLYRGLYRYYWAIGKVDKENAINDIINAKAIKNDVVEAYPNRSLLSGKMKDYDNSLNGVEYSKDMTKLIRVPKDKKDPFIILDSVTEIGESAFSGCTSLTSIKIPESVTEIDGNTFFGCTSLKEIIVDEENPNYCSKDGVLYSKDLSKLIAVSGGKESITIPDSVTEIGGGAFSRCTSLTKIEIPNSVTEIGAVAFGGCTSLTSIEIPESVTKIGKAAFARCTSLTLIEIPASVTEIGDSAFWGCTSLTSIKIPDSVTVIGWGAFEDCTSLTSIKIPKSVTKICGDAFSRCTSLTKIEIPEGVSEICGGAFSRCKSLTSIEIPDSVTEIGEGAIARCTSLTSIEIPDSVTEIGPQAFRGCTSLMDIHFKHKTPVNFRWAFDDFVKSQATIYVPKGSGEAYRNIWYYMGFKIEEEEL